MRVARRAAAALIVVAAAARAAGAQSSREVVAELFTGSAWSLPLPLVVHLGGTTERFTARYHTRPFADAPYYSYRLARSDEARSVEVEMIHHKLYLENARPPVERLEVSHGYDMPMVALATPPHGWQMRVGLGFVVAHPEGRIAGRELGVMRTLLGGGYHIAGVSTQLAVGRRYALGRGATALTAAPEAKLTAALARIPFEGGSIVVPNVALHALGGLGIRRRW
jgi:hypothetical protein